MTGKISLTASMRSNLLSLQNISRQVSSTQNKLATGNKVNSAIDSPSSYYTARSLNNRAGDLDALLDSMGQAVQTIKAATTALETSASFLEQAAAIADQALEGSTSIKDNDNKTNDVQLVTKDLDEYIAAGYTVITADMTADEINALMTEGAKLVLSEDIVLDGQLQLGANNITFNGNGHKMTYDDSTAGNLFFMINMAFGTKLSNMEIDFTAHPDAFGAAIGAAGDVDISSIKITVRGNNSYGIIAADGGKVTLDSADGITLIGTNSQKTSGNDTSGLYDGKGNTQKIVAQLGNKGLAAWAATQFYVGDKNGTFGQGKWYLPAIAELADMYGTDTSQIPPEYYGTDGAIGDNMAKINAAITALKGKGAEAEAMSGYLWSSSEGNSDISWRLILSSGDRNNSGKGCTFYARPCQLLENCFNPLTLSAEGGSGAVAPKIGDVMYADKTWGSADDYDGSKQAVGIVSAVGNDGSVKIVNLKNLTFSSEDGAGNFDPDNPYGGRYSSTYWSTSDEAFTNIIDLPDFTGGTVTVLNDSSKLSTYSAGDGQNTQTKVDTSAQERFNSVLNQYDMLIKDASYKGVNLLKSQTLNVRFNEDGSSDLNVAGKDMTSGALGLNTADWNNMSDIAQSLKEIANALNTIRAFTSELGNNYSIITSRQEFTENLINILTEGADKLTLADMNEESANMLALQTRQQLAINSLSLASQAAQSILKLF